MADNWMQAAIQDADKNEGILILENPETKKYLDDLILLNLWPKIKRKLKASNYEYMPQEKPETDYTLTHTYARSLTFMLFDMGMAFFRGQLHCSLDSWMLESEFFLGLHEENDHHVLFEILGNTRFLGNPPELIITKHADIYFQITFKTGFGKSWLPGSEKDVHRNIDELIEVNTRLYEYTLDGIITEEDIGDFLTTAFRIYESV